MLTASPLLSPELRSRPQDCTAIDQALARATSLAVEGRPQTPGALADMILSHLHTPASRRQPLPRHVEDLLDEALVGVERGVEGDQRKAGGEQRHGRYREGSQAFAVHVFLAVRSGRAQSSSRKSKTAYPTRRKTKSYRPRTASQVPKRW